MGLSYKIHRLIKLLLNPIEWCWYNFYVHNFWLTCSDKRRIIHGFSNSNSNIETKVMCCNHFIVFHSALFHVADTNTYVYKHNITVIML